jgi:hypothetical protein
MKLPEDDEKREREVVEKALAQVRAHSVFMVAALFNDVLSVSNAN